MTIRPARHRAWLGAALATCLAGCASNDPPAASSAPAPAKSAAASASARKFPVEIAVAHPEALAVRVESTGSIEAEDWVQVTAQVEGMLGPLEFNEGDRVSTKTVLVDVDPERYRMAVAQKVASLERTAADLRDKEAGLAKRKALRDKEPGWVPEEEITTWEAQVDQRRAEVSEARSAVDIAKLDLERARIHPPIDGVIEKREATPGQYVKPGTVIASIVRTQPIRVRFSLREEESSFAQAGTPLDFTVPAYPGEHFTGEVFFVGRSADPATRRVEVIARNANTDERLKPGFFAQIVIERATTSDAILLPESAVLATEDGFVAYVLDGTKARKRLLDIGVQSRDGRIEVKRGIASGDSVVVKGAGYLSDGAEVVIAENVTRPAPTTPTVVIPKT